MKYSITFSSFGGHFDGDKSVAADWHYNLPGGRLFEAEPQRVSDERQSMNQALFLLDGDSGAVVLHEWPPTTP